MRISDWSSDVCSSDLDGPKQSELSPGISTSVNTNGHTISPLRLATHRWDSDMTISRKSLLSTFGSLVLALALSGVAVAQDSTPTSGMDKMGAMHRSEEHTSELQSLMRISYAVFCLKKKKPHQTE